MKVKSTFWIGIFFCVTIQSFAQFNLSTEIRPRSELRYGLFSLPSTNQEPAYLINQRTRLTADYQKDKVKFRLTGQDARVWGDDDALSFYEAWIQYKLTENWDLRVGRQALQYDRGRMIAVRNRRQSGFTYDAILAKYAKDSLYIDLGYSLSNSQANFFGNQFSNNNSFKNFSFGYLKKYFDNGLIVSATGINAGYQKVNSDTVFYKQTLGTKIVYPINKISLEGEGFYQFGKHKDGRNVEAYLLAGKVSYKLSKKAKVTIGTEYTSGHDATSTNADYQNTLHTFDILEGARFAFWGNANLFRNNLEAQTNSGGLTEYFIRFNLNPAKKISATITYYQFYLTKPIFDDNNAVLNQNLGGELDIIAKYKIQKGSTLALGYSYILPTNSWQYVQNIPANEGTNGHYLWLSLTSKLKLK
ncbi:MAG: alginate export family protein [Saprospiraceae bacterium]